MHEEASLIAARSQFDHNGLRCFTAILFDPLPQLHLQIFQTLLYYLLATMGYHFRLSGRFSGVWLACNLAIPLSLHQSHDYLSLSSYRHSTAILALSNCYTGFNSLLICVTTVIGFPGESVQDAPPQPTSVVNIPIYSPFPLLLSIVSITFLIYFRSIYLKHTI